MFLCNLGTILCRNSFVFRVSLQAIFRQLLFGWEFLLHSNTPSCIVRLMIVAGFSMTILRNSRVAPTLRSSVLSDFRSALGAPYRGTARIEKSDCDMWTLPLTLGQPCSFASFVNELTALKFFCQYMKASRLMPRSGVCMLFLSSRFPGLCSRIV